MAHQIRLISREFGVARIIQLDTRDTLFWPALTQAFPLKQIFDSPHSVAPLPYFTPLHRPICQHTGINFVLLTHVARHKNSSLATLDRATQTSHTVSRRAHERWVWLYQKHFVKAQKITFSSLELLTQGNPCWSTCANFIYTYHHSSVHPRISQGC